MNTCHACGAAVSSEAEWCGQCFALCGRATPTAATGQPAGGHSVMAPVRTTPTPAALPATMVKTRWRKTATTFGPLGRVLATLALVVPFLVLLVLGVLTGGLEIGGAVIWGVIVMPWGLRDTWRAGQLPAD
jgi:hypothetical protein